MANEDDDDEQLEPLVFPMPEAAYAAFTASMVAAKAHSRRREEALRQLAEAGGHAQEMKRPTDDAREPHQTAFMGFSPSRPTPKAA